MHSERYVVPPAAPALSRHEGLRFLVCPASRSGHKVQCNRRHLIAALLSHDGAVIRAVTPGRLLPLLRMVSYICP
jgi:hypothetical protein